MSEYPKYRAITGEIQVTKQKLTVQLVQERLLKEDEVVKATAAKMKYRNKGTQEIKNPTAGLDRSRKFDNITQIVQDDNFTADAKPKDSGDFIPTADFAEKYTDSMPHGQAGGTGKGENTKSSKSAGATSMKPNQDTKLKEVPGGYSAGVKGTEDDGTQKAFSIPQADFAEVYTDSMAHGSTNMKAKNEEGGEAVAAPKAGTIDGGPTRAGGKKSAKLGDRVAGAKDADKQKVKQVTGPGTEKSKSDAMKWGDQQGTKKETGGAENVVESGVVVTLNGKTKAVYEVVNMKALKRMYEAYAKHGYSLDFHRADNVKWKQDKQFMSLLRESVNATWNFAPKIAQAARKAAMRRFGQLVKESYSEIFYEDRQEFLNTVHTAFKRIEEIAESKYIDRLQPFEAIVRIKDGDQIVDLPVITEATDVNMAARQVRNKVFEEYGFGTPISMIKVDAQIFRPKKIVEYEVKNRAVIQAMRKAAK